MDISSISTNYTVANADKSAEQSNSLQSSLKNISSDSSEEQLKGVIKDFESYFVEQVKWWIRSEKAIHRHCMSR